MLTSQCEELGQTDSAHLPLKNTHVTSEGLGQVNSGHLPLTDAELSEDRHTDETHEEECTTADYGLWGHRV